MAHDDGVPKTGKPRKRRERTQDSAGVSPYGAPVDAYYVSGGKRIRLERDPQQVGVLLEHPAIARSKLRSRLKREGRSLREGIVLVPSSTIPADVGERLEDEGALLPVYAEGDALILVLAEVRVEGTDLGQVPSIKTWLKGAKGEADIVEQRGTRVTVRPRSGRPADALRIANEVDEQVHPALSQARFLRIVPPR